MMSNVGGVPVVRVPLVSVVMIFLDAAAFMDEAIQSVVAQTYRRWELILVDDGSTDASPQIATRWVNHDRERIRYVTHPDSVNLGMSASRNLGIREARGTYIAFLDADDVYLPHKLAAQVEILEREKLAAMIYGPSIHWYSWDPAREGRRDVSRRLGVKPDRLVQPPMLISRFLSLEAQPPGTCSFLVRRSVCESRRRLRDRLPWDLRGSGVLLQGLCRVARLRRVDVPRLVPSTR